MPAERTIPDFVVVGAPKSGTTSLYYYLSHHPDIGVTRPKELNFFIGSDPLSPSDPAVARWHRGWQWYRDHFDERCRSCGEVSPLYVGGAWRRIVMERMRRLLPDVKLILLVREPMARLRSHYLMAQRRPGSPPLTFTEFVQHPDFSEAVTHSDYGSQIAAILEHFPRESLLVVESADLDHDRERTLSTIFGFLGVDRDVRLPAFQHRLYDRKQHRFPSPVGRRILNSRLVVAIKRHLPFVVYRAVTNALLLPFSIEDPDTSLDPAVEARLIERFRGEVATARTLTGLPLASLDGAER